MEKRLPVHRIIPFSNVEGLGNRTSIFVQGCNANCHYCHNSETIPMRSENVKNYTIDEISTLINRYRPFISGVTVSGGEATLHHKFLVPLFENFHNKGLTCYVDTNGFFNYDEIKSLIEVTDKFLFDIKGIDEGLDELCFSSFFHMGAKLANDHMSRFSERQEHFDNLDRLLALDKIEEIRFVYVKGYFDEKKLVDKIAARLLKYPHVAFKLIRVHARGLTKERAINLKGKIPSKEEFDELVLYTKSLGVNNIITIF